ncbi:LacI family DNA-binding transcriptional regulator [Cryobacterium breve]|uniref:LacI family DNA-binding transcriptional regulator n=2 Tax=Microbacteriaceae TaxID=85023 RepID=A0ABY2J7G4_9MICO|nr:LacI family DNA-binding transcriptional regulator [Cryobacterium sp. TmT3-12]TFC99631.1 LacI family DNA-binding transcriptional regulator [Cryobacterium breve]
MSQVAARAGVSVMTVSYTYNRVDRVSAESREKVLQAAAELGYAGPDPAARSLRYGNTRTLGVILGEHLTYAFDNPQAVTFLAGIAEVCADRGYGMLIVPIAGGAEDSLRVSEVAVDAFIIWTTTDDDPVLDAVSGSGRPAVIHGGPVRAGFKLVSIDNRAAAFAMGMKTFAGAHRPAILSFPLDSSRKTVLAAGIDPDTVRFPVTRQRLLGYRDAIEALGLDWNDVVVGATATNNEGEARSLAETMFALEQPIDAIAAMSDDLALGVLDAATSAQLTVPETLSVSGWDNSRASALHQLSSVAQNLRAQGALAARLALGEEPGLAPDDWSVVVRASTGEPATQRTEHGNTPIRRMGANREPFVRSDGLS